MPTPGGRPSGGTWVNNGLEAPDLSGVDPVHPLTSPAGLSDDFGLLTDSDLLGTAEYLVECALPLGTSVTKTVDGQTVVLEGLLGLAPEWETGECDEDCQEWVSACLLARTNVTGESMELWLEGDHEALGWEAPPDALFEAGFYGNLFVDPDAQYYCKGSPEGVVAAKREGRTCTSGNGQACGFTKYNKCFKHDRCDEAGPDGDAPANCRADGPATYHTIATYVVP